MFCYECSPPYAFGNFIMAMPVTYCPIINLNNCVGWRHIFINSSGQEQNRKPAVRGPRLFPLLYAPFVRLYKQRTSLVGFPRNAIYNRFGHKKRWCHSMPSEGAPNQAFRGCTARSFQGCHFAAPARNSTQTLPYRGRHLAGTKQPPDTAISRASQGSQWGFYKIWSTRPSPRPNLRVRNCPLSVMGVKVSLVCSTVPFFRRMDIFSQYGEVINSINPRDSHMHHWPGSPLTQVMA